jgi:hypothetical protein
MTVDIEKMRALALAACPFCGSQPKMRTETLDERFAYANQVTIQCQSCGCSRSAVGDTSKPGYADNSTTERRAIEAWSRRTAPAAGTERDALLLAKEAIEAAQRNHGAMLYSDPPQEAWKARGVDDKLRAALKAIDAAIGEAGKEPAC